VLVALCVGCTPPNEEVRRLQTQVGAQKQRITELEEANIALKKTVDDQAKQVAALREIGPLEFDKMILPVQIELDRLTGGYDEDGLPGDDGVVAYVKPIDADGDVIKAAGSLVMEVFDLANPPAQSLVAHAELDLDNTRKAWHGWLWTNHFTIKCPWPPPARKPPAHRDLTVRVQFTGYVTGKTFTAQTTCTVKLPADVTPAATKP